ncbi:MAG TPA: alpha/beta fold hydrolase [Polyangiaceae bacterium]|nr:alpha/beta fold hydrolase [Polyangiaceae bacterium]
MPNEPSARSPAARPSEAPREIPFGDTSVRFFVPKGVEKPAFVLVLHGLGGSGAELAEALGLAQFAGAKQFMFAAPDGTLDTSGRRFWNANQVCCNFSGEKLDDVARLMALVDHAVSLGADSKRVFVVGYSNGGFMAHRLACEHAKRVRAIVSLAATGPGPSEPCAPSQAVSVLEIHGDHDSIVPFEGGHLFGRDEFPIAPSVRSGFATWARAAACEGELRAFERLDLTVELAGTETQSYRYSSCRESSPLLWKVEGAGHTIPLGAPALNAIWGFLSAQR